MDIASGLGSLKALKDIVQGLNAANIQTSINDVKIQLQGHVIEAQTALAEAGEAKAAAAERIRELEQEIVRLKNWEADKQRYELADAGQGTVAFRPKAGMENGEPQHWLCPNCVGQEKTSILQPEHHRVGRVDRLVCHACSLNIIISGTVYQTGNPTVISQKPTFGRR